MSSSQHSQYTLDACGCRSDSEARPLFNPPGQNPIQHRTQSFSEFRKDLLDALRKHPSWQALTSRQADEPFIALLDSAASVSDIVAFYQDRWVNEHYLHTATEPRAIEDLIAQIGYQPNPSLGAHALLAYKLTDAPGSPDPVVIPKGSGSMSQPVEGGEPRYFETTEDLLARITWNRIPARLRTHQTLSPGLNILHLNGVSHNLKPGDRLLIQRAALSSSNSAFVARVAHVAEDTETQQTAVTLVQPLPGFFSSPPAAGYPKVYAFRLSASAYGSNAPGWRALPASLKREVLGLDEDADIPDDQKLEWPDYHIHLPTKTPLSESIAPTYSVSPTPESIAEAIKEAARQRADSALDAAKTEMSSLGFSGITSGLTLVDAAAKITTELFQASAKALSDVTSASNHIGTLTTDFFNRLLSGLRSIFTFDVNFPSQGSIPSDENAFDAMARFFKSLTGNLKLNPGLPSAFFTNATVRDLMLATPLGWPLRLRGQLSQIIPGEGITLGKKLADQAGVALDELEDTLERVERTFKANVELAIAFQARNVIEASIDAALNIPTPDQFPSRKAFIGYVSIAASRFVTLPWQITNINTIQGALSGPSSPQNPSSIYHPSKFQPGVFQASTYRNRPATSTDLAITAYAASFLPPEVTLPMLGFAHFANLISKGDIEDYAKGYQNSIATSLEEAMLPQYKSLPSIAGVSSAFDPRTVSLDAAYSVIVPGSKVLLGINGSFQPFEVDSSETRARADFGLSGKSTILTLKPEDLSDYRNKVRELVVLAQSEELPLGSRPLSDYLSGDTIEIPPQTDLLPASRKLIFSGISSLGNEEERFPVEVEAHTPGMQATVQLKQSLSRSYLRSSIVLYGNVASANEGQSGFEILGNGDPAQAFQSFTLKQSPISHYASDNPDSLTQALTIEVDGRAWSRVRSFYEQPADARIYITREDPDGRLTVTFGDGNTGARLPRGTSNVVARYRFGAGTGGNVPAGLIKVPLSLPLGVQGVSNPIAADGGTDRQKPEHSRSIAPLTTKALRRIVTLRDHESWARVYPGVAKARADVIWHGGRETILLTVAGDHGSAIPEGSTLHDSLTSAFDAARHGRKACVISTFEHLRFRIRGRLQPSDGYRFEQAEEAVHSLLTENYKFEERELGQHVFMSELIRLIHAHPMIDGVMIDALVPEISEPGFIPRKVLLAPLGRSTPTGLLPAALLTLSESEQAIQFQPFSHS